MANRLKRRVPFHVNRAALTVVFFLFLVGVTLGRGENTRTKVGGIDTRVVDIEKRVVRIEGKTNCARISPLGGGVIRLTPVPCPPRLKDEKGVVDGRGQRNPHGQPGGHSAPRPGSSPRPAPPSRPSIPTPMLPPVPPLPDPCAAHPALPCLPSRPNPLAVQPRRPRITGTWYGGCIPINPNMPDFPECRRF